MFLNNDLKESYSTTVQKYSIRAKVIAPYKHRMNSSMPLEAELNYWKICCT